MEPEILLVALGDEDRDRVRDIATNVRKIADPAETRVVVGHVLSESTFESAAEHLSESGGGEADPETAPRPDPGTGTLSARMADREEAPSDIDDPDTVVRQLQMVRDLVDELTTAGVDFEVRGAVGDPAEELLAMASDLSADFVLVGGRQKSPASKALFGSVSERIIREADCPVITLRGAA